MLKLHGNVDVCTRLHGTCIGSELQCHLRPKVVETTAEISG